MSKPSYLKQTFFFVFCLISSSVLAKIEGNFGLIFLRNSMHALEKRYAMDVTIHHPLNENFWLGSSFMFNFHDEKHRNVIDVKNNFFSFLFGLSYQYSFILLWNFDLGSGVCVEHISYRFFKRTSSHFDYQPLLWSKAGCSYFFYKKWSLSIFGLTQKRLHDRKIDYGVFGGVGFSLE